MDIQKEPAAALRKRRNVLVRQLPVVGLGPVVRPQANRLVAVDDRSAVDPELLERLLEDVAAHAGP